MKNLKVYIDRLREEAEHKIEETIPPEFLDIREKELRFADPVHIRITAYLAEDHLMIHLDAETVASLPCCICNDPVRLPIKIKNHILAQPLKEIKEAIYDCTNEVRETILLHVPLFTECNLGQCPERENVKKFIISEDDPLSEGKSSYFPFANFL